MSPFTAQRMPLVRAGMTKIVSAADLVSAIRARDRRTINDVAARLLDQGAALREQWLDVAQVLVRNGEMALALAAAGLGVEQSRRSAKVLFGQANILAAVGRQGEAIALVSDMPATQLDPAQRDHFVGTCALEAGDLDLARNRFDRVVAVSQGAGPSWLSLAALPLIDDEALLARMNDAASAVGAAPPDYRAQWHYAKGTVLDRLGRTDEAFMEFAAGAAIMKPMHGYDPAADRAEVGALTSDFTSAAVDAIARQVETDTSRPIFVTGLPRSGTTLVEHVLAGHSAIAGGGEVPFASVLTREIGGNSIARLDSFVADHGADELARLYLHLGDERFGEGARFVDKWLGTTRSLGVLAAVLPEAKIIWLRRDPLDCAWSCFRTYFSQRIDWSWSLADIAAHFAAEDRLYAHWREVLGERMLTLSYEELVAEPQAQIGRILDHVGLDMEPSMEAAHRTKRAVTSASVAQVREPIYQRSVGAAQPYLAHLGPFLEAYQAPPSGG